ncbi:MAG: hypothetical protein WD270_00065 [Acetobacterales bacterium]
MYNVLEALREGRSLNDTEKAIHEKGLVSTLKDLHDRVDAAVAAAYGWPADLSETGILERLVALNRERAAAEAWKKIFWLRPEYQNPQGRAREAARQGAELDLGEAALAAAGKGAWPKSLPERVQVVRAALDALDRPASAEEIAAMFRRARRRDVQGLLEILAALNHVRVEGGRYAAR